MTEFPEVKARSAQSGTLSSAVMRTGKFRSGAVPFLRPAAGMLTLLLLAAGAAERPAEQGMGDDAFARRDYRNAVIFYRNALKLSAGNDTAWAENALKLGEASLHSGDVAAAEAVLQEFRKRFPARSAGLLPGKLMIARGNLPEAIEFFEAMQKNPGDTEKEKIEHQLGYAKLMAGDFIAARRCFQALAKSADPVWKESGFYGSAYAEIKLGELDTAARMLANTDPDHRWTRRLRLLMLIADGKDAEFAQAWRSFDKSGESGPDDFLYRLLDAAADSAIRRREVKTAVAYLTEAYDYAGNDLERRDNLRKRINLESSTDPDAAANTIKTYIELFPTADDRGLLLLQGGRLLAAAGRYSEAIEFFDRMLSDSDILLEERVAAASDAAAAAERSGDVHTVKRMYGFLIRSASDWRERLSAECDFGEYYLRRGRYQEAVDLFRQVTAQGSGETSERADYLLLQALIGARQLPEALTTAESLSKASNPEYREFARYQLARILELQEKTEVARQRYLEFSAAFPNSSRALDARFAAARLVAKLGDSLTAAREFRDFAQEHPKSENAPAAWFFALQNAGMTGDRAGVETGLRGLSGYADSPARVTGILEAAEFFTGHGDFRAALKALGEISEAALSPAESAELQLARARALDRGNRHAEALAQLKRLLDSHPDSAVAADAALMAGRLDFVLGNYQEAREYFGRAAQLRPAGIFGDLAALGMADCAVQLAAESDQTGELRNAAAIYRRVMDESKFPALQLRSGYHLGRCLEKTGDTAGALAAWERTLYLAAEQRRRGVSPASTWCAKAAYAAARQLITGQDPDGRQRAIRVIRQYEELGLPDVGEDFRRLKQNIRSQYRRR